MLISQIKVASIGRDLFFINGNKDSIKDYVEGDKFYWVGSARSALKKLLESIDLKRVGVSSYTCDTVLESVKRAGKEVVFYDSSIVFDFDSILKIIDEIDILVISHNFGFVGDLVSLKKLCDEKGVILIEDCAQALGATINGKKVGSFGESCVYSFGISKNIGFCGGLISTNREVDLSGLKNFPKIKIFRLIMESIISPLVFNKYVYPISQKFVGGRIKSKGGFYDYKLPGFAKNQILNKFGRYKSVLKIRRKNAKYCIDNLNGVVDFVLPIEGSNPAWLYFALLFDNNDEKGKFVKDLFQEGVEVGEMKTFKCLSDKGIQAKDIENRVLTFSLYRSLNEIKYIVEKIKKVRNGEDVRLL